MTPDMPNAATYPGSRLPRIDQVADVLASCAESRSGSRGPGPLEIVATQVSTDIKHFTNKEQARLL